MPLRSITALIFVVTAAALSGGPSAGQDGAGAQAPERFRGRTSEEWLQALKSAQPAARLEAIIALRQLNLGGWAVFDLMRALRDPDPFVRQLTADALGDFRAGRALAAGTLGELLSDADPHVRRSAAEAMRGLGGGAGRIVPALTKALRDPDARIRAACAGVLGGVGADAESAAPALTECLTDASADVRGAAAGALGSVGAGAKNAGPALIKLLSDPEIAVRRAAAGALGEIDVDGAAAVGPLLECLKDRDELLVRSAAKALGRLGPAAEPAVQPLIAVVGDQRREWETRLAAVEALGRLGKIALPALDALRAALRDDDDEDVRLAADAAIRQIEIHLPADQRKPPARPAPPVARPGPGEVFRVDPLPAPKDIVYVVDRSGSLSEHADFVKNELAKAVNKLNSTQRVNVFYFSDGPIESLDEGLVPATEDNKQKVFRKLGELEFRGKTEPLEAMKRALALDTELMYLFTDGGFDEALVDEILRVNNARAKPARINVLFFPVHGDEPDAALKRLVEQSKGRLKMVDGVKFAGG